MGPSNTLTGHLTGFSRPRGLVTEFPDVRAVEVGERLADVRDYPCVFLHKRHRQKRRKDQRIPLCRRARVSVLEKISKPRVIRRYSAQIPGFHCLGC